MRDLDRLDLSASRRLRKDINRRKAEALAAASTRPKAFGFSLTDLLTELKVARNLGTLKYINPEGPAQTWSGYGRPPKWFTDALAAGRALEELTI